LKIIIIIFIFISTLFSNEKLEEINPFSTNLTQAEKQYIKDKKSINICLKNGHEPLMIKDAYGYSGISIDFLNLISESTNLKLN